jgi:Predicted esterase
MEMYLGKNTNYSTNEEFYLTKKDLEILKLNNVSKIKSPSDYLVLIETGDDVIPFKHTLDFYKSCNFCIVNGGSHSFDSFKEKLEIISKFMKL